MPDAELRFRIDVAIEHVELVRRIEKIRTPVGDGRAGFVVWQAVRRGQMWASAARRQNGDAESVPFLSRPAARGKNIALASRCAAGGVGCIRVPAAYH